MGDTHTSKMFDTEMLDWFNDYQNIYETVKLVLYTISLINFFRPRDTSSGSLLCILYGNYEILIKTDLLTSIKFLTRFLQIPYSWFACSESQYNFSVRFL